MGLVSLDHVNLRTTRLDEMVEWYTRVLQMQVGPRPPFPFPGAWLYAGGRPHVHLIGVETEGAGAETELKLEHFAFSATDLDAFEGHLEALNIPCRRVEVPGVDIVQLNVWDPDGNHIHVDFAVGD